MMFVALLVAGLVQIPAQSTPDAVAGQLREFSTPIGPSMRSDGKPIPFETRRLDLYRRLAAFGKPGVMAMARVLGEGDVPLRSGAALALNFLGAVSLEGSKVDVLPALPALTRALADSEVMVRAWSAQAIGTIGPDAVSAVPSLIALLGRSDAASRNSACLGLRGIGPAAREALPALKAALGDPGKDTRDFAARAIAAIEKNARPTVTWLVPSAHP